MCGIAGFLEPLGGTGSPSVTPRRRLDGMLHALRHRGPDDWGMTFFALPGDSRTAESDHVATWPAAQAALALGHRRLAILDLHPRGRQPMATPDGSLCLTFNGEIYNYRELRQELAPYVSFQTDTDTEVLLQAYRCWGRDML